MSIKKINNPTHFDCYGRQISRGGEMLRNISCDCYSNNQSNNTSNNQFGNTNNFNVSNCGCNITSNLDNNEDKISSKYNDCSSLYNEINKDVVYDKENNNSCDCNGCSNNAFFFNHKNIRIKFVGFIFENVNYIVDLDNREVFYKAFSNNCYTKLQRKISVCTNSITSAYTLAFNLAACKHHAEVEVFPNILNKCIVTITTLDTYDKVQLEEEFICIEFFDKMNMLDNNGNLMTMYGYADVFNLTEEDLMQLYTYPECIKLIYDMICSVKNNKDFVEVVKNLMITIKKRILYKNSCDCGDNNTKDDEFSDIKFPLENNSSCKCNNTNKEDYLNLDSKRFAGTYKDEYGEEIRLIYATLYSDREDNSSITIQDVYDNIYELKKEVGSTNSLIWRLTYNMDDLLNCTGISIDIYEIDYEGNILRLYKKLYYKKTNKLSGISLVEKLEDKFEIQLKDKTENVFYRYTELNDMTIPPEIKSELKLTTNKASHIILSELDDIKDIRYFPSFAKINYNTLDENKVTKVIEDLSDVKEIKLGFKIKSNGIFIKNASFIINEEDEYVKNIKKVNITPYSSYSEIVINMKEKKYIDYFLKYGGQLSLVLDVDDKGKIKTTFVDLFVNEKVEEELPPEEDNKNPSNPDDSNDDNKEPSLPELGEGEVEFPDNGEGDGELPPEDDETTTF